MRFPLTEMSIFFDIRWILKSKETLICYAHKMQLSQSMMDAPVFISTIPKEVNATISLDIRAMDEET